MSQRVYTRKGDDGTTSLADGTRVHKHADLLESYGSLDELVAWLGVCKALVRSQDWRAGRAEREWLASSLDQIQQELMGVASLLAKASVELDLAESTVRLERLMDEMSARLEPLTEFVVPGRCVVESWLHVARTVCRRAERTAVRARAPGDVLAYLNRLSDLLFVAARFASRLAGERDQRWRED